MALGEAYVNIRANLAPLEKGLARARQLVTSSLRRIARATMRMGKIAVVALLAIGAAAVKVAMDAQESENLFEVSMGKMADSTRKWSDELSGALGLNAFEVRRMTATLNVMFDSMGVGKKDAVGMAKSLTLLAQDMASFYNLKPAEAFRKIQSGMTGMIMPLKQIGIVLSQGLVEAKAGMMGLKGELTEAQKVQIRYILLMEQTKGAQGDLARTMYSFTNQLRRLSSVVRNAAVDFGLELMPALGEVAERVIAFVRETDFAKWGQMVGDTMWKVIDYFDELYDVLKNSGWKTAMQYITEDMIIAFDKALDFLRKEVLPLGIDVGREIGKGIYEGIKQARAAKWAPYTGWAGIESGALDSWNKGLIPFSPQNVRETLNLNSQYQGQVY